MSNIDFIKDLETAGVPRKQAEVQVRIMSDHTKDFVTKEYLSTEFKLFRAEVNNKFVALESKMDTKFAQMESQLAVRFGQIDARFGAIDSKFGLVDTRFGAIDSKLGAIEARFGPIDAKFGVIEGELKVLHQKIDDLPNRMLMYYAGSTITLFILLEKTGTFWEWLRHFMH